SAAAHCARAIVLPAPGGPVTTVSGHHLVPSAISLVTRGRGTAQPGTPGTVIFDSRIGVSTPGRRAGSRTLRARDGGGTARRAWDRTPVTCGSARLTCPPGQ